MEPFFSERLVGPVMLVTFETESLMTSTDLERISQGLYRLVDEDHHKELLLDFAKVRYLSSQAIGILLTLHKKTKAAGGKLVLRGVGPQLMELLKLTKLNRVFTIQ